MIPGVWTRWSHELPPLDVKIEGKYDRDIMGNPTAERVSVGKRCRRGCCFVIDGVGNCLRPTWWRVPETTSLGEE